MNRAAPFIAHLFDVIAFGTLAALSPSPAASASMPVGDGVSLGHAALTFTTCGDARLDNGLLTQFVGN